ncbi:MAG: hypothetical protein AAFO03_18045 [Bacteroidota bacterium]
MEVYEIIIPIILAIVFIAAYGTYVFTMLSKLFHTHVQWGIPKHRVSFLIAVLLIGGIYLVLIPEVHHIDIIYDNFYTAYAWILVFALPYAFQRIFTSKVFYPNRYFGDREKKGIWDVIKGLAVLIGVIVIIIGVIRFIRDWSTNTFSYALENLKGSFYLAMVFSYILQFYEGYDESFDDTIVTYEDYAEQRFALYIRSFNSDHTPFLYGWINKRFLGKGDNNYKDRNPTFTELFQHGITEAFGELIVLGDPQRYVPIAGVKNAYYTDESWKDNFKKWADSAQAIFSVPQHTAGLKFEFSYIAEKGLFEKTFIVTPIYMNRLFRTSFSDKYTKYVRSIEEVRWEDYVAEMKELGFVLPQLEPPSGTVFGFNADGTSVLLKSRAWNPLEICELVQERLEGEK